MAHAVLRQPYVRRLLIPATLLAAAAAVYGGVVTHQFLLNQDDGPYIVSNPAVQALGWDNLRTIFTRVHLGNYAPLHLLSYALDVAAWGPAPGIYALENVLLHAVSAYLLALLFRRLTGSTAGAVAAGLVFLVHPVQVESVAWISQRKSVLAMVGTLASFHLFLSYRDGPRERSRRAYALSLGAFFLALLAKSTPVVLPAILAVFDRCDPREEVRRRWLKDKVPYAVVAAAFAALTVLAQSPETGGGRTGPHGGSWLATFLTMTTVLPQYLRLLAWPSGLSALYVPELHRQLDGAVVGGIVACAALAALGWLLYRRARPVFPWYATFFLGLAPVSQLVPLVTLMNDRYLYFPMIGAAGLLGAVVAAGSRLVVGSWRPVAAGAVAVALAALGVVAAARVPAWRDDLTLWQDTVAKVPHSPDAWYNLGRSYQDRNELAPAAQAYARAIELNPADASALLNLSSIHLARRDPVRAIPLLLRTLELRPAWYEAQLNLGISFYLSGDDAAAEAPLLAAVGLRPDSAQANHLLGRVYLRERRPEDALARLSAAARLGGSNPGLEFELARACALQGDADRALAHLQAALQGGFRSIDAIRTAPELDPVRQSPRFRAMLAAYFGA